MNEISTLLENFGFPIAVCLACFYFIYTTQQQYRKDNKDREELLFTRIGEISTSLAEVVATLERINDRLTDLEDRKEGEK